MSEVRVKKGNANKNHGIKVDKKIKVLNTLKE